MASVSIAIIGHNESGHLRELLPRLKWATEIVYVDCNSADDSYLIAQKAGCKVFRQPNNPNLNVNKSFAISQSTSDWIFYLDPDERIPENLAEEIVSKISQPDSYRAFFVKRKNHYFGKWLKHGGQYPDLQLRLFEKNYASFPQRHVHERLQVRGKVGHLQNDLLHFPYLSISQYLQKFDFYTSFEANYLAEHGLKANFWNSGRFLIFIPTSRFIRRYFFKLGFLDGWQGLFAALFDSINFMVRYFKLKEILKNKKDNR